MPIHPRADEDRHVQALIEPCELPDGIELVYADNRDRAAAEWLPAALRAPVLDVLFAGERLAQMLSGEKF
jgi:hypothetical protein